MGAAYVVELREAGAAAGERLFRSAPPATLGSVVELRVGGLRPGLPPGRCYVAQVRVTALCGCESAPSAPGWSPPLGASTAPSAAASAAPASAPAAAAPSDSWTPPPWITSSGP